MTRYGGEDAHPNHPKPDPAIRQPKINQVALYKAQGKSFAWIAEKMEISSATAWGYYQEYCKDQGAPEAKAVRNLALEQYEELIQKAWAVMDEAFEPADKLKAIAVLDKLLKSVRELFGTDAAIKYQEVRAEDNGHDRPDIADIVEEGQEIDRENAARVRRGGSRRRSA
jgi:hypothetical protein